MPTRLVDQCRCCIHHRPDKGECRIYKNLEPDEQAQVGQVRAPALDENGQCRCFFASVEEYHFWTLQATIEDFVRMPGGRLVRRRASK
jgi:hypothetical protein